MSFFTMVAVANLDAALETEAETFLTIDFKLETVILLEAALLVIAEPERLKVNSRTTEAKRLAALETATDAVRTNKCVTCPTTVASLPAALETETEAERA